jgi:hypothetical protein
LVVVECGVRQFAAVLSMSRHLLPATWHVPPLPGPELAMHIPPFLQSASTFLHSSGPQFLLLFDEKC